MNRVGSTDKTELSGRGKGPRPGVYLEVVRIEWPQVCLVSPVGQALLRGRNKEAGKNRQGKNTPNTEPSQGLFNKKL